MVLGSVTNNKYLSYVQFFEINTNMTREITYNPGKLINSVNLEFSVEELANSMQTFRLCDHQNATHV